MDILELESFKLADAVKFHTKLNPKLWIDNKLDPKVRDQLLLIAKDFVSELGVKDLDVKDVTISGSNAAYSYTRHSDIDLHIVVDINKLSDDEIYQELFTAKKTLYNDSHNVTIRGIPVELYVQDANKTHVSLGEYSLLRDEWNKIPKKQRANFDQHATKAKFENLSALVELALKSKDLAKVQKMIDDIRRYRQAGLDRHGEFSPENLAFKAIRTQGGIDKLYALRDKLHSEKLSIEEELSNEDYDPNGPPPGPEFKPTMPKGTVRVDVSDVYDWYKLGQHISNLDGLGKHDFGQGPPSTILSFGDEDLEHKYITALKKTGLNTTDIDPVDPNQPKGMKRQKVDPTYNVNEGKPKQVAYHVTPTKNLQSIAKNGLTPTIGDRSSKIENEKNGIFLFPDKVSAEDAVMNWLGDEFEDEHLTMLKIDISGLEDSITKGAGYEMILDKVIEPSRIKKVNIDLSEASGYIPNEKEKNDPRFKSALTVDVKPDSIQKNAKAFGFKTSRAGIPPKLQADGKF